MRAVMILGLVLVGCGGSSDPPATRPVCDADMVLACPGAAGVSQVICEPEDVSADWCYFDDTSLALEPAIIAQPECAAPDSFAVCPPGFRARCLRCPEDLEPMAHPPCVMEMPPDEATIGVFRSDACRP